MTTTTQGSERFNGVRERIERGLIEHTIPSLTVAMAQGRTTKSTQAANAPGDD